VKIVITVGLPGSGKSTYLKKLGVNAISSDEIRRLIADDPEEQSIHAAVFSTIRYLIRQRIRAGRRVTRWERRPYIALARRNNCKLEALFFDVPVEACIQRNQNRGRVVPEAAILRMAGRLEAPARKEGFARIIRLRSRR